MLDMLRPVHDTLHNVIDPFCGDPSFLGMCHEFWAGMLVAAVVAKYGGNKNIQDFLSKFIKKKEEKDEAKA